MTPISAEGTYKFNVLDHCVNASSGGFPQLVITARAYAIYNGEAEAWQETYTADDGEEYRYEDLDMQTTAYLVLCNAEKRFLNYEQVMAAFGWNGESYPGLNDMPLEGMSFLGQVRENDYNGNINLRVEWIDHIDGSPTRGLKKLDAAGLKDLDAKFGSLAPDKIAAPAKAPAKGKGKGKGKPKPPKPPAAPTAEPAAEPAAEAPATSPPPPAAKSTPDNDTRPFGVDGMTKAEAWGRLCSLKKANVTDGHLADSFLESVVEIAGSGEEDAVDEDTITPVQWRDIAVLALDKIPHRKF